MYYILISNTTCNHKLNSLFYYLFFFSLFSIRVLENESRRDVLSQTKKEKATEKMELLKN